MQCLKCGREIQPPDVFCPGCQEDMAAHPVAPDVTVALPPDCGKPRAPRKVTVKISPEEQIQALQTRTKKLKRTIRTLVILLALALGLLFFAVRHILQEHPVIGQNYQTPTSTASSTAPVDATREGLAP